MITLTFNQCSKCKTGKYLGQLNLTQNDLNTVPYLVNQIIIFKDSIGDSVCFNNFSRSSTRETLYDLNGYDYRQVEQNCDINYYNAERNSTIFLGIYENQMNIDLAYTNSSNYSYTFKKYLLFNVSFKDSLLLTSTVTFPIDSLNINYSVNSPGSLISYYDSLLIGNRYFYSVYKLKQTLYYSLNNGVVGFKTNDNKIWHKTN